jgi:putative aldouronate transport system substrate-binding protein
MNKGTMILSASLTALTTALVAGVNAQTGLPPVELTYTYPGGVPKDVALVAEALTALVKPKINATIKLEPVDWGAYDQKRSLSLAAGEKCDIMFTAPWINNFGRNISQGSLLPLDDLLKQNAPKLYSSMAPSNWDAARSGGKIYGVINQQAFAKTWGVVVLASQAKKYNLNLNTINTYAALEPFLAAVKKGEKFSPIFLDNSGNNTVFHPEQFGFDPILEPFIGVKYNDSKLKAVSMLDSPDFKRMALMARRWNLAGYFPKDLASQGDVDVLKKAGQGAAVLDQWRPDSQTQWRGRYGSEIIGKSLTKPILTTGALSATMNGICKTSPNPERAIMFLELLNTDPTIYNTLAKGIEGKHWVYKDKAKQIIGLPEGVTAETSTYSPGTDWMFGNLFNAYPNTEDAIQETKDSIALNKSSIPSVALGFNFDQAPIKTELAQLTAVFKEFALPLIWGQVDVAKGSSELSSRLKAAGIARVLSEAQLQLNAWKATK